MILLANTLHVITRRRIAGLFIAVNVIERECLVFLSLFGWFSSQWRMRPTQPRFRSTTTPIVVDVVILKRGHLLRGQRSHGVRFPKSLLVRRAVAGIQAHDFDTSSLTA
jgi:hypothetical protein